jgi:hypothetical protein
VQADFPGAFLTLLQHLVKYCYVISATTDGVWIGNQIYGILTLVTTNNYVSLTELHTSKVTVTTADISLLRLH